MATLTVVCMSCGHSERQEVSGVNGFDSSKHEVHVSSCNNCSNSGGSFLQNGATTLGNIVAAPIDWISDNLLF